MPISKITKLPKVKIEHLLLESKNATFVALINEVLIWGEQNGISGEAMWHIIRSFERKETNK